MVDRRKRAEEGEEIVASRSMKALGQEEEDERINKGVRKEGNLCGRNISY